jgi:2-C-methyl-D-erythritol 4-phosphate cytidylyltransferase/2-C-methyl-D-erythritol 2,4-cyclodiphosphate synthase
VTKAFADAVVVAAGASTRMLGIDKLSVELEGRSLLAWSVEAMAAAASVARIVVVVRAGQLAGLSTAPWRSDRVELIAGGERRSDSVRAGVARTRSEVVLIHDAARPLATPVLADRVARAARQHGAAVPVLPVVDSLKKASAGSLVSIERDGLVRTQTPQGARRELLLDAFAAAGESAFTDEAALLESRGVAVASVRGEVTNMKVTEPADLELVRELVRGRADERLGFGQDSHPFGPGLGLRLGGLEIHDAPRLHGHSDGDVVLHALATAVLSGCGLGDVGRVFPAGEQRTRGIDSALLVAGALEHASRAGWRVGRAQVSLVGARPKIGAVRLDMMRDRLAELLGTDSSAVAVTASSGNLTGAEGAGRVISATALVAMVRR